MGIVGRSRRYQFRRNDGDTSQTIDGGILIPVANGTFLTERMSMDYSLGSVFIQFFSGTVDNPTPVTPTAGQVTVESGVYAGQWLMPSQSGSHIIQATTILAASDGVATYEPPSFNSQVLFSRIILDGITGATFMVADHWRSVL